MDRRIGTDPSHAVSSDASHCYQQFLSCDYEHILAGNKAYLGCARGARWVGIGWRDTGMPPWLRWKESR
jgi:hypothetical protein